MILRSYYSIRTGKLTPDQKLNLAVLKKLFLIAYTKLSNEGYFQKYFGIDCTDGFIEGKLGQDIESIAFLNLRKENLYPIFKNIPNYSEDDLFDMIEFLHDYSSKGLDGTYHQWNQCGVHYENFDDEEGRKDYREAVNPILKDYMAGFELSEQGEILIISDTGLSTLLEAKVPTDDHENIKNKLDNAILKFRRHKSTFDERKEAIRELADILEFLRPQIKVQLLKKDENDLFNIANNFGIRHHNTDQKTDYDKAIWYSWIFYYYLATIHSLLRLIQKHG